jgi:membrane-anchored protein YejM (alkaline phosphatase superfamily)
MCVYACLCVSVLVFVCIRRLSRMNITYLEEVYRNRLRALRAVDELLGRVVRQLEQLGVMDSTYVIFTSDNGYHMGTHRRASGELYARLPCKCKLRPLQSIHARILVTCSMEP